MSRCQFCRKNIDEDKLMLHEMYCERNCIKCNRCGLMYDQNDPESHEEEFHVLQQCPHCKKEFQDLDKHQCQEIPILCNYCQLQFPIKSYAQHEIQCGSRTEMCNSCKQYVKKSDLNNHQEICFQKKFDKLARGEQLDDFPSLQQTKQTYVSPQMDQQNKYKQELQKQNQTKFQTQQQQAVNNAQIKSSKQEQPNEQQPQKQVDYNNKNYKKEVNNYKNINSNNSVPDKIQDNQFSSDPNKKNNYPSRFTQPTPQTQELKQNSDRIQNNQTEYQYGKLNNNNNINKYQNEDDEKQLRGYKQQPSSTQKSNNSQEIPSLNQKRQYQEFSYPYQGSQSQQNQINSPQFQYPYQQEINKQDPQSIKFQPSQDKYTTDTQQNNNNQYTKNYSANKYYDKVQLSSNNKGSQDNKYISGQTQLQQRPDIYDRDQKQKNNYRSDVVPKPLANFDKNYNDPQQPVQPNQFQYKRNQQAHQDAKYQNSSMQQEQQPKQNEYKPYSESQTKHQSQRIEKNYDSQQNYEYNKQMYDQRPQNNVNQNIPQNLDNNDSIIARQLQDQILADDLQMTESQINEQRQLYKMLEENAQKQKQAQNRIQQQNKEIREPNQYPQNVIPNDFEFLTEEEKQMQKQLFESMELQKKKRW